MKGQLFKKVFWGLLLLAVAMCLAAIVYSGILGARKSIAQMNIQLEKQDAQEIMQSFRVVREQMRAMQKAQLNDIAHDATADAEIINMAQKQLLDLYRREEQEMNIQGFLEMQGWMGAIASVHEGNVNVILYAESINQAQTSMILDMVCRETGVLSGNVKIIPIN